jgi:hypothetical protein
MCWSYDGEKSVHGEPCCGFEKCFCTGPAGDWEDLEDDSAVQE